MSLFDIVRKEVGWEDNISIPIANQENKKLEEQIQEKIRKLAQIKSEINSQNEQVTIIRNHLHSVQEQFTEIQNLRQAKQREIDLENHFQTLLKAENGRLNQERKSLQKEIVHLEEKKSHHKNIITQATEKIKFIQDGIEWDQEAMDLWLEQAVEKDDDANLFKTFITEDNYKIKELQIQLEKLSKCAQQKKKTLDKTAIDLKMAQIDLEKTAMAYKTAHEQKQDYIKQWETTIQQMQKRDEEMEKYISEIIKLKEKTENLVILRQEKEKQLKNQLGDNRDLEHKIKELEKELVKVKQQYTETDSKCRDMKGEVELLNATTNSAHVELDQLQKAVDDLDKTLKMQNSKLHKEKEERNNVKTTLLEKAKEFVTSEDVVIRHETILSEEKTKLAFEQKKLDDLHKNLKTQNKLLQSAYDHEKKLIAEHQGLKSLDRRLTLKMQQLNEKLETQDQTLSNQENEVEKLENRIKVLEGSHQSSDQQELDNRVQMLQKVLNEKTLTHQALLQETKQQQKELLVAQRETDKLKTKKEATRAKLEEVNLHNESGERKLKEMTAEKQKLMVDENILKLEQRRFQDVITSKSANVISLERQKIEFKTIIHKRQQEIEMDKEIFKTEIRMLGDSKQKLIAELNKCRSKTKTLQNKFDILMLPLQQWKSEELTPVHFLIKIAEDKETLKKENLEMENKVQKAKKDMITFRNTARLLTAKNDCLRKSLMPQHSNGEQNEEKRKLEEEITEALKNLESKKKQHEALKETIMQQQETLDSVLSQEKKLNEQFTIKNEQLQVIDADVTEQQTKYQRAQQQLSKRLRELEPMNNFNYIQKDITLRLIREKNRKIVNAISDFTTKHAETIPVVNQYFEKANLPHPWKHQNTSGRSSTSSFQNLPTVHTATSSNPSTSSGRTIAQGVPTTPTLPSVVNVNFVTNTTINNFNEHSSRRIRPRNNTKTLNKRN